MSASSPNERSDSSTLEDVGAALKREGREIAGEARTTAYRMACDQRDALAGFVGALAGAAGRGAEELEGSGYARSAAAVKRTADEVGGLAGRLQQRQPDELWEDVEDFAREHPVAFFGAGFALAFGFMRFLKSAAPEEPEAQTGAGAQTGPQFAAGRNQAPSSQAPSSQAGSSQRSGKPQPGTPRVPQWAARRPPAADDGGEASWLITR